jgi:hypothetical protein
MEKIMARQKKNVRETVEELYPDFTSEVGALTVDSLEKRLSSYAKRAEEIEEAKEGDEELERTRELLTELGAPYKDGKKEVRLKSRYIISLIKDRGGN